MTVSLSVYFKGYGLDGPLLAIGQACFKLGLDIQPPSQLFFVGVVVLLLSTDNNLQLTLGEFAVECEAARMRIGTFISEGGVPTLGLGKLPGSSGGIKGE